MVNVSNRFDTLFSMGFWGYLIMSLFTILGLIYALAKKDDIKAVYFLITTYFINMLIGTFVFIPLTIMILVYRLSHSGKVCSGDFRY